MSFLYQKVFRPLLFKMEPETAHEFGVRALELVAQSRLLRNIVGTLSRKKSKEGSIEAFGLDFPNRVGQAAGLDKDGRFPAASSAIGFGHIEVGTVTPKAQPGNPKPRLFRFAKEEALVNRMGFNNQGASELTKRISSTFPKGLRSVPLGINIGKGKATPVEDAFEDYAACFRTVMKQADYITVNISSPNTPDLRKLHQTNYLEPLLKSLRDLRRSLSQERKSPPCLLKISPDETFSQIEELVGRAMDYEFDGIIACNTSVNPPLSMQRQCLPEGGISGKPIDFKSTEVIRFINQITQGRISIIGSGGVYDAESAQRKLDAGACLLQLYTSFIFRGPFWPSKLARALPLAKGW